MTSAIFIFLLYVKFLYICEVSLYRSTFDNCIYMIIYMHS